ncbi:MAG: hypothetical protein GY862_36060 [Gammaproteobacteria bacterium]|nr:hypothetical protein [Gammaproteobacteria bacterium]
MQGVFAPGAQRTEPPTLTRYSPRIEIILRHLVDADTHPPLNPVQAYDFVPDL